MRQLHILDSLPQRIKHQCNLREPKVYQILLMLQILVLVHGTSVDGSFWNKVIPILQNAGHKVIAAQLPLHSLADDVDTVKREIGLIGGPVTLVGHSYGGFVISNARL